MSLTLKEAPFSQDELDQAAVDAGEWTRKSSYTYATHALDDMESGEEGMIVYDGDKAVAIASYTNIENMYEENDGIAEDMDEDYQMNPVIWISWLAGDGAGGGSLIINQLKNWAENDDGCLMVEPDGDSPIFYSKFGFKKFGHGVLMVLYT